MTARLFYYAGPIKKIMKSAQPSSVAAPQRLPLFADLAPNELALISEDVSLRYFEPGEMIFSEGDPCRELLIVREGDVKLLKTSANGRQQVLSVERLGNSLAEVPVFDVCRWKGRNKVYVIAESCIGVKDTACVDACPVDAIHPSTKEPGGDIPQLYISEDCICCAACVPACPVSAIYAEEDLHEAWKHYAQINRDWYSRRSPWTPYEATSTPTLPSALEQAAMR